MTKRYWDNEGQHQALYQKLHDLIPGSGPVPGARSDCRALEKLRVAGNCYYDLFNNGLCNRAAEFRRVFGFGGKVIANRSFNRYMHESILLEQKMDEIILAAAKEQGVTAPPPPAPIEAFDPVI